MQRNISTVKLKLDACKMFKFPGRLVDGSHIFTVPKVTMYRNKFHREDDNRWVIESWRHMFHFHVKLNNFRNPQSFDEQTHKQWTTNSLLVYHNSEIVLFSAPKTFWWRNVTSMRSSTSVLKKKIISH